MENPYIAGDPVRGANLFGREKEIEFILDALKSRDKTPILLHGQRRVGKSSILWHLQTEIFPNQNVASVFLDLQHISFHGNPDTHFDQILTDMVEAFEKDFEFTSPPHSSSTPMETYFVEEFIPAVFQAIDDRPLVVLVDEFDSLPNFEASSSTAGRESTAHKLMTLFNHLSGREEINISFIVVVGRQFDHLPQNIRALMNSLRAQVIWLLNREKTFDLITKPVEKLPLQYQPAALNQIHQLTQGHPYFTQAICSEIFEKLTFSGATTVTADEVKAIIEKVLTAYNTGFSWLWADLSAPRRLILAALAEIETTDQPATMTDIDQVLQHHHLNLEDSNLLEELTYLVQHKTLQQFDDPGAPAHYQISIELVRMWVKEKRSIGYLKDHITSLIPEADSVYEKAVSFVETNELEKARIALEQVVRQNPYHTAAQIMLGDVLQKTGNSEQAVKVYRQAYALEPDQAREKLIASLLSHGTNLEEQKRQREVSTVYQEVLTLDPTKPAAKQKLAEWFAKGREAYERQNWPEAIHFLERVVNVQSDYHENQAHQLLEEARRARAVEGKRLPAIARLTPRWLLWGGGGIAVLLVIISLLFFTGASDSLVAMIGLTRSTPTPTPTSTTVPTQTPRYIVIIEVPTETPPPTPTPGPTDTPVPTGQPTPTPTNTPSPIPTPTETATPIPIPPPPPDEPTYTPTPFIIEITATPTPTPPPLNLPAGRAFDVALLNDSDSQRAIAVIEGKGIFQTEDGGYRWEPLWEAGDNPAVDSTRLYDLAVAPTDARSIYVAGSDLVMYSHDGGINWEISRGKHATPGYLPDKAQVYSFAVGHQDPMLVYAATQKGVFRSLDGGETWQPLDKDVSDNFIEDPIYTVAIDPTSSDKAVYAAGLGDRILYNTENANDQRKFKWKIEVCRPCRSAIYVLIFDPDGTAFAGSEEGILAKKKADSQEWVLNDPPIVPSQTVNLIISNLVIDPSDPDVIYAGTGWRLNPMALGLYRSQNGGATWQQMNEGLPSHENPAPYVQGIAAAKDGTLFIATHDGVYQRNDEGQWERE